MYPQPQYYGSQSWFESSSSPPSSSSMFYPGSDISALPFTTATTTINPTTTTIMNHKQQGHGPETSFMMAINGTAGASGAGGGYPSTPESTSTVPLAQANDRNNKKCKKVKRQCKSYDDDNNNNSNDHDDDESTDSEESSPKSLSTMADNNSNMADNSCHLMSRKKRRGMIEKRRRDRINNSLHELKRLVPAAFEKQGSAKLEKAEILQMTVDHLRMLHSKGFDAFSFDPHKFATDYHIIGFRECSAEVARYLVVNEGLDFQDPLRLRLISHLQCYAAQREISLKSSTGWNPSLFTTPMYPPPAMPTSGTAGAVAAATGSTSSVTPVPSTSTSVATNNTLHSTSSSHNNSNVSTTCESMSSMSSTSNPSTSVQQQHSPYGSSYYAQPYDKLDHLSSNGGGASSSLAKSETTWHSDQSANPKSPMSPAFTTLGAYSTSVAVNTPPVSSISTSQSSTNSYSYSYPAGAPYFAPAPTYMAAVVPGPAGVTTTQPGSGQSNASAQHSVKHYRPWGTELAY